MLARRLACPTCSVHLRVAETVPVGKVIRCPKCGSGFPVPGENGANGSPPPPPKGVAAAPRRVAPPPEEEEDQEQETRKPVSEPRKRTGTKKRRKKPKQRESSSALAWGVLAGGGLLLVGAAVALVFAWRNADKKEAPVAENPAPVSVPVRRPMAAQSQQPESEQPATEAQPETSQVQPAAEPQPAELQPTAESSLAAAGQQVFQTHNCARCHQIGSQGGGRARGPNLASVGRNPEHTVEWLMEHVRNPQSHRPESRMPAYEGKISEGDLRALGEFLVSLK
jgi:mono/diheme cytochrome c family protein